MDDDTSGCVADGGEHLGSADDDATECGVDVVVFAEYADANIGEPASADANAGALPTAAESDDAAEYVDWAMRTALAD